MTTKRTRPSARTNPRGPRFVVAGLGVVVVLAAVIAIGASGGDSGTPDTTTTTAAGGGGAGEYQPVTVDGEPLVALGDGTPDPSVGVSAPVLTGFSFDGTPMTVGGGAGGSPTMLVFLAHWCPHCNREVPRLLEWKRQGLVPMNLRVVGVATASRNDLANWPPSEWLRDFAWPWETMADDQVGTAASAYGVDGFPFMVILDGAGKVAYRMSGEIEVEDLVRTIDNVLGIN